MEESGQLHILTTLPLGKEPPGTLDRKLGGLQSQSEYGGEEKKIPAPTRN